MTISLRAAMALILVAALAGHAAGRMQTERRLAFEWTAASIAHNHKGNVVHE